MKEEFKFPAKASKGRLQQTMIFFDDSLSGQECLSQKKKTTKISQKSMKKGKEKKKNQKKKKKKKKRISFFTPIIITLSLNIQFL